MRTPSKYNDQVDRIREKLERARRLDGDCAVFGSSKHRYRIGPPIDADRIAAFERLNGIQLPDDFVAFLSRVGHGSPVGKDAAAGPFYGIDALAENALPREFAEALSRSPLVHPKLSDDEWEQSGRRRSASDETDRRYDGLLIIGHQGCDQYHAIVVAGQDRGRVVNFDWAGGKKPRFAFEANFLDWYERWLDEVSAGILTQHRPMSFGYVMGGDDRALMQVFGAAIDAETRYEAILGLLKLDRVDTETCHRLDQICGEPDETVGNAALFALTKFDVALAQPHLIKRACGNDPDRLVACQAVIRYARPACSVIAKQLLETIGRIEDFETFQHALHVLGESGVPYAEAILPFATHPDVRFRGTTFYRLGQVPDKARFLDVFLTGLRDDATSVVHGTLQALVGVTDDRLLPAYQDVAARFQTDEGYVRLNLQHRLAEFGFASVAAFERGERTDTAGGP